MACRSPGGQRWRFRSKHSDLRIISKLPRCVLHPTRRHMHSRFGLLCTRGMRPCGRLRKRSRERMFAWPCSGDVQAWCSFRDSQAPIVDLFYAGDELLAAHDLALRHLLFCHVLCIHAYVDMYIWIVWNLGCRCRATRKAHGFGLRRWGRLRDFLNSGRRKPSAGRFPGWTA